ncbi:MAG: GNAT family N-acetyltransferase [Bacteroidota bacterium]
MTTENFNIDQLISTDAHQLHQFMVENNERLRKFFPLTLSSNDTIEKTIAYIALKEEEIQEKTNFTFAIREKSTLKIAGLIIIKKIDWTTKKGEFAYCIGAEFEGKGLTTFAVKELSKFAFDKLDLKTLQIIAHKTNHGSVKVAEKCGFIWKGILLNEFTPTNEKPLDMELYELAHEK